MKDLLDLLHHAENIHAEKSGVDPVGERVYPSRKKSRRGIGDISALLSAIRLKTGRGDSEPETAGHDKKQEEPCFSCRQLPTVVSCGNKHPFCAKCMDNAVWKAPSNTTDKFQLLCQKLGCTSEPFTAREICKVVSPNVWNYHLQKGIKQDVGEINDRMKKLESIVDKCLPGWALQAANAEQLKLCPTVVMVTPIAVDDRVDLKTKLRKLGKQTYKMVFYCECSGQPGHEPFEISVNRDWIVKVAPWLRLALKIATTWDLPFLDHSEEMKALIKALGDKEKHRNKQILEGEGLKAIAEMAEKKKSQWKESMVPVLGTNGRTIWVKKEFEKEYGVLECSSFHC
jgi:hypothetical protein